MIWHKKRNIYGKYLRAKTDRVKISVSIKIETPEILNVMNKTNKFREASKSLR